MDAFEERFNRKKAGQENAQPIEDVTTTQQVEEQVNDKVDLLPQEQGTLPPETNETPVEEIPSGESEGQVNKDNQPDENSVDFWKDKYERLDKQKRDLQSWNDTRFNELKEQIASLSKAPQQVQEQPQKPAIDKDAFNDEFFDNPYAALEKFAQTFAGQAQPQVDMNTIEFRIKEEAVKSLHDDYDEVIAVFNQAQSVNPEILAKVQQAPNPIKAAYDEGKRLMQAYKIQQDPEAYEKELRQKWEEELNQNVNPKRGVHNVPNSAPPPRTQVKPQGRDDAFNSRFNRRVGKARGIA